jgi:poly(3-hydroxyalkanoate) synthetase
MTLLAHIDEPESVERYIERRRWFAWSQQLPDRFRDWMIEELFLTNRLISNELRVEEGIVALESISCPVFLIAGSDDEFTPPEQMWALERYISTPPEHITRRLVNGGHLSVIIDPAVLEEVWRPVMRSVAALSATSEGDHSPSP